MSNHTCHCKDSIVSWIKDHFECHECEGVLECYYCHEPAIAIADKEYVCDGHLMMEKFNEEYTCN